MKKLALNILVLAAVIGIMPTSIYPVDITKDGITIRVSNEQNRSEKLKDRNLACIYIRIKNKTNELIEIPKHAISSPFIANEKVLKEAMGTATLESIAFLADFVIGAATHICAGQVISETVKFSTGMNLSRDTLRNMYISSPITGTIFAVLSYYHRASMVAMLQEYLDRKATTIQIGGEVGLYVYVNLDQYRRSISKNITIRLHKKDTGQVILFDIDTTDVLQTQTA